ncbi:MAG TPA: amino acid adenylation domain-containing protein [Thermoanaerobaculia bacterium]|nr:amino acid adenylation domain-containing protein [Thermoanaerobaculia bacterium]
MRSRSELAPPAESLSRQLGYWRRRLAGAPAGLDLPTDFPRPAIQTFSGGSRAADLTAEQTADLRALCRREGVTLFMLLLAGFDVLLARYSGQEDVLVGSPVETGGMLGLFVNFVVLRTNLGTVSSFRELLSQVRETVLEAYGHRDLPFEVLVEELLPERDRSRPPFFQVLLSPRGGFESPKLDLSLAAIDSDAALRLEVEYNADLFAAATASRLLGHLGRLLEEAVLDPERGWRDLPLLTEAEREQLLAGFNDTGSISGPEACLHQLFEAQAARNPGRVALVAPEGRLTYGELNGRAEGLAARLRELGLGPERLAGVLMDRTADLIVTLLAVLKAGGAYAPLDPNYPRQRVLLMLETSRARVLVTRRHLAETLGGELPEGLRTVFLDPGWESEPVAEGEIRRRPPLPDNLAYVIFTSGSTGVPKGVAIQHRSAVAMIRWAHAMYSPEEYAGVLASTSICFDMSVFEIFATLAEGGKIILAENALALPRLEAKDEVVLVDTVPSAMAELLRIGGLPPSIRTVNLGGEALKGSLVREIHDKLPGVERVVNLYGPSEDTTFSTWSVVPPDAGHPLIGRPLTGESAYVLDAGMRPVPLGIPGSLYLGGEGVTRGYLNRPDLTAERYVPNPYGPPGSRLYRVGDLVRYLPSGELDYLGRLDHQVKVRGFRIELGEIESALTRHPEVREAAVLAAPDVLGGGTRLIAYVETEGDLPSGELREFLRISLPDYMVPSSFVTLRRLPLTPNGKIDRRALAAMPLPAESAAPPEDRAPGSYAEEILAGIWSEVFGRKVGVNESFFDLGGDSLLAARLLARVRAALGLDLSPVSVLEATVAGLAEQVERALAEQPLASPLPPVAPRPRDGRGGPLSSAQRRLWFLERLLPGTPANNIPIVMRLDGPLAPAVLERSLVAVAARHEALRTTIELGPDGEPRQIVAPPVPFPLPLADLSGLPAARRPGERARLAREEARRPFDPEGEELWRRRLLRVGEREHDLLVTFHHVIADGESVQVLESELAVLHEAFLHGRPSPLPALAVQPADVAAWETEGLTPEVLAPHLAWFREHLAGAPAGLDLPADLPRPPARTWRGVSHALALPPGLSRHVREFARRQGATAYMVLLASWAALLRRITGQDDVVVGTVLAHRGRPELEGLIGFFANTLPLRVERPGDPAFGDLLATVRTGALGLYAHQDLPLEPLTEALRPGRTSAAEPLFQAFFAHHGNAGRREMAPGLTLTWREEEHGAAQFDLVLDLEDGGEEIGGRLVASADLFTRATVERLARGWTALLADAVARPKAPVSALALIGAAERHALLVEWSRPPLPPAWSGSVPARIAAWAAATPGAVAVLPAEPGGPALTYGELVARAHGLAGRLRARGVGPGVLVGVYAERSPETLIGMLAVLLAGGAFLPLDPAYPAERLALILEDSGVEVLLARPALAAALPTGGAEIVPLDGADGLAAVPEILEDVDPGDLAYVIYTSGSTGRPKGVLIPHRGFLWAVEALAERSGVVPGSRVLQFASAGFDASVWEIWSTLVRGATLVLARPEDLLPGPPLLATLRQRGITNVFLTPTALAAMPEGAERELSGLRGLLRGLVVGGEAFPPDLVARWAPGRRLWNAYGPTEASICVTMARLGEDGQTPIGRPVGDSRLLVLGRHLEPLPRGVPGELYLGGRGLAHGYLGKPDLTARAFLPDPFSGQAGARLYRTGDLVRFRPDGQLEFLGRADRQVKVRGFRIEPGEIEAQIAEHPGVREAVVVPYEAAPRDLRLAAYVAAAGPADIASHELAHELRAFLRSRLPEHMVPSSFTFLPALPLSPGGKVDRRALPPPVPDEPETAGGLAAPLTPAEELLAGIWGEVLGGVEAGAADDFFDLGGHSLLVGRVLARVRSAFGVELPVRAAFEARTLAALARRIEEALRALTANVREGLPPRPPLVRTSRAEPLPLSFAQQRLWFLDRMAPGSPVYNLPAAFRLSGPLDPRALERGLDEVFRRHEALRTTFAEGPDGEPRQVVVPFHPTGLPRVDLTALPPAAARAEAARHAAREARCPFDLARGPVARALLLRLGEQEHHLLFLCHHAAFDGWSVGVLQRELGALYGAFAAGRPSPLSELSLQYGDFAVWQRRWLSGKALEAQLAYWRERLADAPAVLELPADRPRPPAQSFRGATVELALPAGIAAGLRALARGESSTLFITALTAFHALLGRFTGQRDLVVGSPVAGRTEAGIEDLLGFFVNTLALRADLTGDPSFQTLLGRVRESALSAYAAQDLPFERLVEELQPERDLSRSPLFQVVFSLDPVQGGELAPGLVCEPLGLDTGTAKFDLTLFLQENKAGLKAVLEYATDLFDAPTVARLGHSYRVLLSGLVEEGGGSPVSGLPLLGAGERWQILGEWHEPGPGTPADRCLHELVAAQIERTPSAVALVAGHERITYGDLALRTGQLARRLAALGVGPEVRVGVFLSRSPALIVTLLGILEAGGAYVPLDPNYPRERLELMLEDAGIAVVVTEKALASRLPESRARTLVLDGETEDRPAPADIEPLRALPGNLAYLIYTSGSTGRPKAVAIEHRSAVSMVRWAQGVFSPEELAGVLASTSISFDVSVAELFVTLASGGRLILANNVLELPDLPAAGEVTLVSAVPSAISAMAELGALPAGVKTVNLGGEPVKNSLARALHASGVERVRNLYGPSEDTTYSTFELVERESRREPTIGRPIAGSWARVLDRELGLVPVGVPGEIHLGGAGLARGYFGRPELTAERFVPDPLGSLGGTPGERLYRTGDLGRWLPDGRIEYLGRLDHQVKVRGIRIELGEIEAALTAHPGVREAVVVALEETGGDRSLAAYFVAAGQPAPAAAELRDHLRGRLAEPMVPSSFTRLERLPLNPNGKVDRKALPAPGIEMEETGGPATPRTPADPLVELLAGIWADVLGREDLPGAEDDFFELGGHSLLATRVVSRVREALGIELPLRALFAAPTVLDLAADVAAQRGLAENLARTTPIEPLPDRSGLPLSFAQQRLWLLDRLEPGSTVYNLPLDYRIDGRLDVTSLEHALGEIVRRHEVLRTTFVEERGEPRLAVAPAGPFSLPRVDLSGLPAPTRSIEAGRLAREEAGRPFDLAAGPLFRTVLLASGAQEHRLLITMHHIATDGWSVDVLQGELSALYRAFTAGLSSPLPELPIQYADFAAWQRRWLAGPVYEAQLGYWRRQLAGAPEALDLPTDRPRPAVETSRGASFSVPLPPALAAGVRALSRRQGATLFMTLLAGFAAQLHRYTGAADLLLGSPVANRNRAEIEGLLGFFVNTLVLRAGLGGDPGFDKLLAQVREMALGAYAHQDLPFERLVEELRPQRSLAHGPFFQVSFVLGVEEEARELAPGLPLSRLPVESRTSKFDLTLALEAQGDGLIADFEYRTDLLDRATVTRWAGHFAHLLASVIASPDAPLSKIGLLSAEERHQLAREWNDTAAGPAPPADLCLHQLFEAQVARAPEAVALVSPDGRRRLSYRELDGRAEALARRLRALGVGPEVLAGVLMDRTVELVVSLLAVLKAGGAYVPIDPAYPRQRVATLLTNSRAAVLLTRRSLLADFADSLPPAAVPLFVEEIAEETEDAAAVPRPQPLPGNLAYVIYTSGSTGEPKGVAIEHRSAVAFARWAREVYTPEERAGVLGSTSVCFDISIMEIFVTLAWGGKILLAENVLALPALPARGEVTMINAVPSAMAELVRGDRLPDSVRVVNVGGEAVTGPLARRIYEQSRAERVVDVYGPSEDTTYSMTSHIPRDMETPAVGRPIRGTRAYILDAGLRPVPIGVPGAVYLAGDGLARGYLGRPALTAERFIPDPHGEPGARLYRVGDLARWRTDGEMEYLGRIDHQVKLRGFRIELGEIEAVLASHPAVQRAVVATHAYGPEDLRLVAWVVPEVSEVSETMATIEPEALLAWAGERLPEYMVPSAAVVLDALPLTPNGKVDRLSLPLPDVSSSLAPAEPPRTALEELVAGLWSEVLGCGAIGLHDDFFSLGGYSLLAIRLLARLRAATGVELPLRALFAYPTVADMAAEVERNLRASDAPALPPIEPAGVGEEAPASPGQERLWFFHQLDPGGSVLNVPHPLRLTGPLRPAALARALAGIARRHASLRTSFSLGETGLRQRIAPPPAVRVKLPLADLGALPPPRREEEARRLMMEEAREPFDLAAGPLWRARLLRLGEEDHRLLLTFHHTISDGWSTDLFNRDLAALYGSQTLPEPELQYADFAVWQRRWLTDEALAPQLAYWRRQLAGMPPVLDLPADRPRPPRRSFRGEVRFLPLPSGLAAQVKELGRREGTTLFMTALAAFAALIGRYTGRTDVVLGSPAAHRHQPGTEGIFGFFAGNLVLRLDLGGDPTFRELLRRAREAALGAYAHPDVPFERLVEELDPARDKSRNPLVQVMLSVQAASGEPFRFAGLAAEPVVMHNATSQFDFTLFANEGPEGLVLAAEYSTDLFEGSTAERMLAHVSALLAAVVADPDLRLSALPAEIAPPAAVSAPEASQASPASPEQAGEAAEAERARRQALLAERRARLAGSQKELLESRLRRGK